jgi:glycine/D-amino acid oxidase-like deaminating enzyme
MDDLPRRVECVVVGGGIVGAATALELRRAGVGVLLLEHGELGSGVTGASLAALAQHALARIDDLPVILAAGRRWATLADELEVGFDYRRQGQLRLIADPEEVPRFAALVEEHRALGSPLELLDESALRTLEPGLGPDAACAAVLSPLDASVQALRAVHAVVDAARALGADVRCGVTVEAIRESAAAVELRTSSGVVGADHVVIAAGPWTADIVAPLGVELPLEARRARCAITDRLPPLLARIASGVEVGGGLGIGEGYFQLQQAPTGQFLFNTVVDGAIGEPDGWWGPEVDEAFLIASARTLARVVPAVRGARLLRSWAAVEAWTPDRRFLCGPLDGHPHVLVAAGDSGSGFLRAPLLGALIADALLDRPSEVDRAQFAPDRFAAVA